jgi:hypothetical protein
MAVNSSRTSDLRPPPNKYVQNFEKSGRGTEKSARFSERATPRARLVESLQLQSERARGIAPMPAIQNARRFAYRPACSFRTRRNRHMSQTRNPQDASVKPLGCSVRAFAKAIGICATTIYTLSGEEAPRRVRVGNRVLVVETPEEYIARLQQLQRKAA